MAILGMNFFQVAWIVDDIEAAMRDRVDNHATGPFFYVPNIWSQNARFKGEPVSYLHSGAMAQSGNVQIELVQHHDGDVTLYSDRDTIENNRLHHIGAIADNLDYVIDQYTARGVDTILEGSFGEVRFVYMDTRKEIGCFTEIIQRGPAIERMMTVLADATADWKGEDPIRLLSDYY